MLPASLGVLESISWDRENILMKRCVFSVLFISLFGDYVTQGAELESSPMRITPGEY